MTSFFNNEIWEDEDVREANNAQKLFWFVLCFAVLVMGGMFLFNRYLETLL